MSKEIYYSDDARNKLYKGVTQLADAVRVTMGPRGRNVLLQNTFGAPTITKDGVSVAKEISLPDTIENMGAQLVKQVASNTNDEAGDGTTTATVLAHAIFKEGLRNVTAGANPVELKRGMDITTKRIIKQIQDLSKEVDTKEQIEQVATISANGDKSIGKMIATAMDKIGKDGVITVEEANGIEDELEVVEGMEIDRGYLSPHFVNNPEKMTVEMLNPYILFVGKSINNLQELLPILEVVNKAQRPLVIIADDVEGEALSALVTNKLRGSLNVVAVKSPGFGDRRKDTLADMAILTKAVVLDSDTNIPLATGTISHLGTAAKVIVTNNSTTIINGSGDSKDIELRIASMKNILTTLTSDYDKDKLKERLAKLSGGIAIIRVGAPSETEMKERKDRIDDALGATKAAVEEGIIIGGGCALIKTLNIASTDLVDDEKIGADIIGRAIQAPIRQIAMNAGFDAGVIVNAVRESGLAEGFDASTGKYVNMFDTGIVDPTKVLRVALLNAVSVASMLLTTECTVSDIPTDRDDISPMTLPGM